MNLRLKFAALIAKRNRKHVAEYAEKKLSEFLKETPHESGQRV